MAGFDFSENAPSHPGRSQELPLPVGERESTSIATRPVPIHYARIAPWPAGGGYARRKRIQGCKTFMRKMSAGLLCLLLASCPLWGQSNGMDVRHAAAAIDARYNGMKSLRAEFTELY